MRDTFENRGKRGKKWKRGKCGKNLNFKTLNNIIK
jgi:hypothetical protein